jgi:hypothetical protein
MLKCFYKVEMEEKEKESFAPVVAYKHTSGYMQQRARKPKQTAL